MSIPVTRTLEHVLAEALSQPGGLRLVVGTFGAASADARYANVVVGGATLKVPRLKGGTIGAAGTVAYLLADQTRLLVLGTVGV